jgi:hypothetical protein
MLSYLLYVSNRYHLVVGKKWQVVGDNELLNFRDIHFNAHQAKQLGVSSCVPSVTFFKAVASSCIGIDS